MRSARDRALLALAVVAILAFGVLEGLLYADFYLDDSYISFRYARNIVSGKGFTFNEGEHIQGTTTPLYTLIIAFTLLFFDDPQRTGTVLSILGLCGTALLLLRLFQRRGCPLTGVAVGLIVVTSRLSLHTITMETSLYTFFVVLVLVLKYERKDLPAAVLAPLAFLTRFDGVLLYPLVALDSSRRKLRISPSQILMVALPTAAWLVFSRLYFGSLLPHTFYAKAKIHELSWSKSEFLKGFHYWIENHAFSGSSLLFFYLLVMAVWGIYYDIRTHRFRAWLSFWTFFYFFGYLLINPKYEFPWYQTPLFVALVALHGNVLARLESVSRPVRNRRLAVVGLCVLLVVSIFIVARSMSATMREYTGFPYGYLRNYKEMASYVAQHAQPTDRVAAAEIGIIGYFSDLKVIDLAGLVAPSTRELIQRLGWRFAVARILEAEQPEFMVLNIDGGWSQEIQKNTPLMSRYRLVVTGKKGDRRLGLFERVD